MRLEEIDLSDSEHARLTGAVRDARGRLGAALIRHRIGEATEEDLQQARNALAAAEQELADFDLMAVAMPVVRNEIAATRAVNNHDEREAARAARLAEYESTFDQFERDYRNLVKRGTIKQAALQLFECARKAGRVEELRDHFRANTHRDHGKELAQL